MFVIKIYIDYSWNETYVIPKPTLEEAKRYAFECAKSRCDCSGIPKTYEDFENACNDDESSIFIDVLADDAQLMV